jgi:hypothetical protein
VVELGDVPVPEGDVALDGVSLVDVVPPGVVGADELAVSVGIPGVGTVVDVIGTEEFV